MLVPKDDRVPDRGRDVPAGAALVAELAELDAQPDQVVKGGEVDAPVTTGAIAASHAIARAASPSSQAPPSLPLTDAAARCAAHCARTRAVHSSCSAEVNAARREARAAVLIAVACSRICRQCAWVSAASWVASAAARNLSPARTISAASLTLAKAGVVFTVLVTS